MIRWRWATLSPVMMVMMRMLPTAALSLAEHERRQAAFERHHETGRQQRMGSHPGQQQKDE